ncbi:MAG: bifunctional alpha,alpha-trehalose-phosphate synthase (UDP-forming)/trehalose-phosphatase [Myxococcota bacterium]
MSVEASAAESERPLLVASNRLPVTLQRGSAGLELRPSAGGLVSALEPVLRRRGGTWIGWPGMKLRKGETIPERDHPYRIRAVELSDTEVTRYYHGFSNRTLWPLFHCFPERTRFDRRDWETYDEVNRRFAEMTVTENRGSDLVWVHDYHLMRTPIHLRHRDPGVRIAFFMHIPFPPYDIFRLIPWHRELLNGLLAADLIGFHVPGYARSFLDCVERLLPARVDTRSGLVEHGERTVQVGAFPLGIDFEYFEAQASRIPARPAGGEKIVLGVDRLDYTKGIPERMRAFERLLELHPEHREKVILLQLAVPSRFQVTEYQELKREIDELVGRVNGRFATETWSPIRYLYRSVPRERLAALYRDADVALVTPLRDGMNLVAKEYVASQVGDPGVLILSRLAGAAETMHEAIHVNPYNLDGTAEALHRALTMEEPERRSRMVALRGRERRNDLGTWLDGFLSAAAQRSLKIEPVTASDFEAWLGRYLAGHELALFLDYDGTLTPLRRHPNEATLSPAMRRALQTCAKRDDLDVTVVSGRSLDDIMKIVGIADLTFAGNHGLEIAGPGLETFRHPDIHHYQERLRELAAALAELCPPGAWVEEKQASLTFHYREADASFHEMAAETVRARIQAAGFQARNAHCAIEARPPIGWDKGHAVLHTLRMRYGPSWSEHIRTIYVGDDETDEDAFRVLSGLGITFRVGSAGLPTRATRQLPNVDAVRTLLDWLAHRSTDRNA